MGLKTFITALRPTGMLPARRSSWDLLSLCSALCASPTARRCRHPGLNALLFLFRKGISVPRGSLVLETGEALTLLDWFLERTGAHLHQHHLPSFCPPRVLVLPSRSAFCAVSYSRFSSLLSHPSYLLFSFQHFNRITYTFAPARCLFCSAGTLPWGFSSFLFLAFFFFSNSSSDLLKYFFSS